MAWCCQEQSPSTPTSRGGPSSPLPACQPPTSFEKLSQQGWARSQCPCWNTEQSHLSAPVWHFLPNCLSSLILLTPLPIPKPGPAPAPGAGLDSSSWTRQVLKGGALPEGSARSPGEGDLLSPWAGGGCAGTKGSCESGAHPANIQAAAAALKGHLCCEPQSHIQARLVLLPDSKTLGLSGGPQKMSGLRSCHRSPSASTTCLLSMVG